MENFCAETANIFQFIGQILTVFKIIIPIIIVILGAIDLGKAVISSKPDEIKGATGSLFKRLIAGVVIFFVPTIVNAFFGILADFEDAEGQTDYVICSTCIADPNDSECTDHIK